MAGVDTLHPNYLNRKEYVDIVRDCVAGEIEVKKKKTKYVPDFKAEPNSDRYDDYMVRAVFDGITARTLNGFLGAIFRKEPVIELPSEIEYLRENANGEGLGLEQLSKYSCSETQQAGTIGFLVDYPSVSPSIDAETERVIDAKAYFLPYTFESIINFKTTVINGKTQLSLVVLKEQIDTTPDDFDRDYEWQYRVLRLDEEGYSQQIYDDSQTAVTEMTYPLRQGERFDFIPFFFIGSANNLYEYDKPMLYDIASLNMSMFRNSADYEENLFFHGQMTVGFRTEMTPEQFKEANPKGVVIGARTGINLGPNGGFDSVTAPESSSLDKAMERKEQRMVALGAKLIDKQAANETAEAARIRSASEVSTLSTIVSNTNDAFVNMLKVATMFMGGNENDIVFELNDEFYPSTMTAQEAAVLIQFADRGDISQKDVRDTLRKKGWIDSDRTDEDIDNEVLEQGFNVVDGVEDE